MAGAATADHAHAGAHGAACDCAPCATCTPSDRAVAEIFPHLMDVGEAMLQCGADVHTIEQVLIRLGRAYGAARMNVLVITAVIVVTVSLSDGRELTFSRRVVGEGGTDFAKLEALSRLCNDCIARPLPAGELAARLAAVNAMERPAPSLYAGGVLSAGAFAMFFGGSLVDGAVSALFALLVCFSIRRFKTFTPNTIVFNFATSLVVGILIALLAGATGAFDVNTVIIGVIMLLIPGLAMTNATRDMLSGDTISGVMRFVESLLWATALALGFMAALWLVSSAGFHLDGGTAVQRETWQVAIIVLAGSLGFALFFDVKPKHVAVTAVGGLVTWTVFTVAGVPLGGVFVPCVIASTFAAVYAEALARAFRVPSAIFFIIAIIPLVPGRALYYTMYNAVAGDVAACGDFAVTTLLYAAGIAVGICLIAAVVQTWDIWSGRHERAARAIIGAERSVVSAGRRALGAVRPRRCPEKAEVSEKPDEPDKPDKPGKPGKPGKPKKPSGGPQKPGD